MSNQELVLDEVYGIWATPFWQTWVGCGILFLVTGVFAAVCYALYKSIKARRGSTKEQSLRALHTLAEKAKKGTGETKKIYQELTGIIKSYAQWRYGLPRGMTDYELTTLLVDVGCEKAQQETVHRIIADAQMVKFGRVEALKSQIQQDISAVISFIEQTAKTKQ